MLKVLCESAKRFRGEMPRRSYGKIKFKYVIEISSENNSFQIIDFDKAGVELSVPVRGDRSGTPAVDNLKPYLLADKAMYSLAVPGKGGKERADIVHGGFMDVLRRSFQQTNSKDARSVYNFLREELKTDKVQKEIKSKGIKADDWIAFRTDPREYFYDDDQIAKAWEKYLEKECTSVDAECCICGRKKKTLRIYPWQISFFGYSCPISSFNAESFESFGQSQTSNSPTCFDCAGTATQILQYLILPENKRYHAVISKDEAKGKGERKTPLKNQMAVFWTKDEFAPAQVDETITIDFEELQKTILEAPVIEENLNPPPHEEQLKQLCKYAWSPKVAFREIQDNAFYLAVISPNKSRLVLREWVEVSLVNFLRNVGRYADALTIVSPDGQKAWAPPIPVIFEALKPVKTLLSRRDDDVFIPQKQDVNILLNLLRCCYIGALPAQSLLERAVMRFRVFEKEPETLKQKLRMESRRMALAAAMKLVLVYPRLKEAEEKGKETYEKEVQHMEQLDENESRQSYLCGQLLAILEEVQHQHAFPKRLNATLVDRFYGAASTAPQSVFGSLLSMATKAHMPKLRKNRIKKYDELEKLLEDANEKIMEVNGFPKILNMREQAEFALGFYAQRAKFRK
jgi:CRISPR-associated protein Csd1